MNGRIFVVNINGVLRFLHSDYLIGIPLRAFLTRTALMFQAEAQARVPVDTAHLQRSHAVWVDTTPVPLWAKVGTNVHYAPFVHEGTPPHWVPVAALRGWAQRHGANPYAVQRGIARHGTRPQPWMREAFLAKLGELPRLLGQLAADIIARVR